jgi:uncharacterized membrane protein
MPNPKSTAQIAGHPIHPMVIPFPIAFLVATLLCDVVFWQTADSRWAIAAMWLLGAGGATAMVAALFGLIDFLSEPRIRQIDAAWHHMIGNVVLELLAIFNFYLRYSSGAAEAVRPWGILLSVIVVLLLLFNGWKGGEMVYRRRVGITDT